MKSNPNKKHLYKYEFGTRPNQLLPLYSMINFDDIEIVSSLGALTRFIMVHRILDQLEDDLFQKIIINDIKYIPIYKQNGIENGGNNLMYIDQQTMKALTIFKTEKNPSTKGVNTTKEGYSLYKIIDINTKTNSGSKLLREWMMFPRSDEDIIFYRLDHIEWLTKNVENGKFESISKIKENIKNIKQLSLRIISFRHKYTDWIYLYQSLF